MPTNALSLSAAVLCEIFSLPEFERFHPIAQINYVPNDATAHAPCFFNVPFGNAGGSLIFVSDDTLCDPDDPANTLFMVQNCTPPHTPQIACRYMGSIDVHIIKEFEDIFLQLMHELFAGTQYDISQ